MELSIKVKMSIYQCNIIATWRNQLVAAKKIIGEFSEAQLNLFMQEAELMSSVRPHGSFLKNDSLILGEHVVQFLGVALSPPCILTKYYPSGSVLSHFRTGRIQEWEIKLKIMRGVAAGMDHLHKEKVVHR
jgi:serine/threonine protein kinase